MTGDNCRSANVFNLYRTDRTNRPAASGIFAAKISLASSSRGIKYNCQIKAENLTPCEIKVMTCLGHYCNANG